MLSPSPLAQLDDVRWDLEVDHLALGPRPANGVASVT
jgi:hypothetical protein